MSRKFSGKAGPKTTGVKILGEADSREVEAGDEGLLEEVLGPKEVMKEDIVSPLDAAVESGRDSEAEAEDGRPDEMDKFETRMEDDDCRTPCPIGISVDDGIWTVAWGLSAPWFASTIAPASS